MMRLRYRWWVYVIFVIAIVLLFRFFEPPSLF
jgi:hypothetical protein